MMSRTDSRAWLALAIALYVASLLCNNPLAPGRRFGGLIVLLQGWRALQAVRVVGAFNAFPWLANVAGMLAWLGLLTRRYRLAALMASLAVLLGLSFLLRNSTAGAGTSFAQPPPVGVSFGLWIGSFCCTLVAALVGFRDKNSSF